MVVSAFREETFTAVASSRYMLNIMSHCHQLYESLVTALRPVCLSAQQAQTEARWLLEDLLHISPEAIWRQDSIALSSDQQNQLQLVLQQRLQARRPIQHILGQAMFYGRWFSVSPAVLVPRPETERLVTLALDMLTAAKPLFSSCAPVVVDVGTGSGCIALTLALEYPEPTVTWWATDLDGTALAMAQHNAQRLGVTQLQWAQGDGLAALPPSTRVDFLVSNPPYIDPALAATLQPEVRQHEPPHALFAQDAGFAVAKKVVQQACSHWLNPGGWILLELGDGMAQPFMDWLVNRGYTQCRVEADWAGVPRFVVGRWG